MEDEYGGGGQESEENNADDDPQVEAHAVENDDEWGGGDDDHSEGQPAPVRRLRARGEARSSGPPILALLAAVQGGGLFPGARPPQGIAPPVGVDGVIVGAAVCQWQLVLADEVRDLVKECIAGTWILQQAYKSARRTQLVGFLLYVVTEWVELAAFHEIGQGRYPGDLKIEVAGAATVGQFPTVEAFFKEWGVADTGCVLFSLPAWLALYQFRNAGGTFSQVIHAAPLNARHMRKNLVMSYAPNPRDLREFRANALAGRPLQTPPICRNVQWMSRGWDNQHDPNLILDWVDASRWMKNVKDTESAAGSCCRESRIAKKSSTLADSSIFVIL